MRARIALDVVFLAIQAASNKKIVNTLDRAMGELPSRHVPTNPMQESATYKARFQFRIHYLEPNVHPSPYFKSGNQQKLPN
jgi:hypothetical protein